MPYLEDVFREIASVEAYVARKGRADARAQSITPEAAARINNIAEHYPHLSPDALMALGRSGYGPLDKPTGMMSMLAAKVLLRDHPGGRMYGAPSMTPGQRRLLTEGSHAGPAWAPPADNAEAQAAWTDAVKAGLAQRGVLTQPAAWRKGDEWGTFVDVIRRLTKAGLDVPIYDEENDRYLIYDRAATTKAGIEAEERANASTDFPMPNFRLASEAPQAQPGGIFGAVSKVASPVVEALGSGAEGLGGVQEHVPGSVARMGMSGRDQVRGTAMLLDAPLQEIQGQVRNLYGATHHQGVDWWESQSDLGITLTTGIDDAGNGFFVDPESEVATERRRREAERGQIGGHNVTLGRWVADATPFATDSKPSLLLSGLVDLGVAVKGDPSAWALSKMGAAGESRRLFQAADAVGEEQAGMIRGLRNIVNGPTAEKWLDSAGGVDRVKWVAETNSPYEMWRGFNRKINMDLATRLVDTTSPEEARAVLADTLGRSIREVSTAEMPFAGRMPGPPKDMPSRGPIDAWDKDVVGSELERWLYNAGADDETMGRVIDRVARAETPVELNASIRTSLREADGLLDRAGIKDQALRDRLTQLHADSHEEASATFRATMTDQTPTYNMLNVAGTPVHDTGAHLYVEHAPQHLTLPDARAIRRLTSKYSNILAQPDTGELRLPFAVVEAFQNEIWKPFQLVTRIAWPIRVIGEEQIRMAAAGYDSVFSHPISYIAGRLGRGTEDVAGNLLEESSAFKRSMTATHGGWIDRAVPVGTKTVYHKGAVGSAADKFVDSWASEQLTLHADPVARHVLDADSLEEAKTWFSRGAGNKYRGDLAQAHPGKFDTVEQADAYIETVAQRLAYAHGHDADLIDAIRTGKLGDAPMMKGTRLNRDYVKAIESKVDQFAPDKIIGEEMRTVRGRQLSRVGQAWDRSVDAAFGWLMTKRSNNLSRSPTFRQEYWREAERLVPFATEETKASILEAARSTGLSKRALGRLEKARPTGRLSLDEVDLLAKGQALDRTKELLYDLARKGRGMDAARLVFPFGEAWKEVVTRWLGSGGLVWRHPQSVRRFQQLIQGARGESFGKLMGSQDGQGFFWTNDFGEEVFIYPGSQLLTQHLLGVPVPLTGRVQGLSMFGTVMPGLGPVAQIPVGWFLANKPGPEVFKRLLTGLENTKVGPLGTVKEQIMPFGAVGAEDQGDITNLYNYVPPWIKAAMDWASAGDFNEQSWASSVMDTAAYLRSTGRYGDSLADQQQLLEDAQFEARNLYLVKALSAAVAPSSPDFEWMMENNRGDLVRASALANEYREMRDKSPDTAGQDFLDKYGPDVYAVIATSKTTSAEVGTPTTVDGVAWVKSHSGVVDALPHTYGLFAPNGGGDDLTLYREDLRSGAKLRLDPKTWIRLQQNTLGNALWVQAKAQVGEKTTKAESDWLDSIAQDIRAQYPYWNDSSGELETAPTQTMVDELYRAVDNPDLAGTDAVKGLKLYLMARDKAMAFAQDEGFDSFRDARDMADARVWLNDIAAGIVDLHPDFEPLWDFVLSHETRD